MSARWFRSRPPRPRGPRRVATILAASLVLAACSAPGPDSGPGSASGTPRSEGGPATPPGDETEVLDTVRIEVLSSQPDRVSGDDARIRITPSSTGRSADLRVDLDGTDVTASFADDGSHLEGVLTGLVEGTNSLTVTGDGEPLTLRLRAWPRQGPMISGPQTPLLACSPDLGAEATVDTGCIVDRTVRFRHITTDGTLADLEDPTDPPADLRMLEVEGDDVPAIVRIERGVVNRSPYEIAFLADAPPGERTKDPTDDPTTTITPTGNRTLVLRFEDGCGATHGQGRLPDLDRDVELLEAGYAIASATFMDGSVTCNDVVAAETVMMLKERFIEVAGVPDATIGLGTGLGGGQVHLLAQTYPDLLDGGVTVDGFADLISFANDIADCRLLLDWFADGGADWSEAERRAVTGHHHLDLCGVIDDRVGDTFDPAVGCDPAIPEAEIHSSDQPGGIRCTMQDISAIPFGRDPGTDTAIRPIDNTGVQYGLHALENGEITMNRFLDLNEHIGGLGPDGERTDERMDVDAAAIEHLYETGRVSEGAGEQARTPFIDIVRLDDRAPGDLHRALEFRHRVERISFDRPLQQIWRISDPEAATITAAVRALDDWLTSGPSVPGAVPDDAVSRCEIPPADPDAADPATGDTHDGTDTDAASDSREPEFIRGVDVFMIPGEDCLPVELQTDPRFVAGAPATGDVIKCELRPIDPNDYPGRIDARQLERLETIFPDGVCDRNVPGVGQMMPSSTDRSFQDEEVPADLA